MKEFNLSKKMFIDLNKGVKWILSDDIKEFIREIQKEGTIILADDILVIKYSRFMKLAGDKLK